MFSNWFKFDDVPKDTRGSVLNELERLNLRTKSNAIKHLKVLKVLKRLTKNQCAETDKFIDAIEKTTSHEGPFLVPYHAHTGANYMGGDDPDPMHRGIDDLVKIWEFPIVSERHYCSQAGSDTEIAWETLIDDYVLAVAIRRD